MKTTCKAWAMVQKGITNIESPTSVVAPNALLCDFFLGPKDPSRSRGSREWGEFQDGVFHDMWNGSQQRQRGFRAWREYC